MKSCRYTTVSVHASDEEDGVHRAVQEGGYLPRVYREGYTRETYTPRVYTRDIHPGDTLPSPGYTQGTPFLAQVIPRLYPGYTPRLYPGYTQDIHPGTHRGYPCYTQGHTEVTHVTPRLYPGGYPGYTQVIPRRLPSC